MVFSIYDKTGSTQVMEINRNKNTLRSMMHKEMHYSKYQVGRPPWSAEGYWVSGVITQHEPVEIYREKKT